MGHRGNIGQGFQRQGVEMHHPRESQLLRQKLYDNSVPPVEDRSHPSQVNHHVSGCMYEYIRVQWLPELDQVDWGTFHGQPRPKSGAIASPRHSCYGAWLGGVGQVVRRWQASTDQAVG